MSGDNVVSVWDISIRIFHWTLVIAFMVAYFGGEAEADIHIDAGYLILGLLAYRLVCGFVGSKYARFSDFLYGPITIVRYLKGVVTGQPRHYVGHNPAGGLMVIVLLVTLFAAVWSGILLYAEEGKGPLANQNSILVSTAHANDDGEEENDNSTGEEFWEEIHELTSYLALILAVLHIVGVFVSSRIHHENLVKAMVTGKKTLP